MRIEQLPVVHMQHNCFSKQGSRVLKVPSCWCSRAKIYLNNQFLKASQFFFPLSSPSHSQVKIENTVKERTNLPLRSFVFSFFFTLYRKEGLEVLALYAA